MVCLDTAVLIWGVQGVEEGSVHPMVHRAQSLLVQLEERGDRIMVPSPVVAEYLVKIPTENHGKVLAIFERRFQVASFDGKAAALAAQLWSKHLRDANDGTEIRSRQGIKFDCQIIATAVAAGASILYSHDKKHMPKYGEGYIKVSDIPETPEQPGLFDSP